MKGDEFKNHLTLENKLLAYQSVMGKGFSEGTFKSSTAFYNLALILAFSLVKFQYALRWDF
jgi:hypothetical protein